MLLSVASPSPGHSRPRRAWRLALRYLGLFPVAALAFGILSILIGALVLPPQHATGFQRLLTSVVTFSFTAIAALLLSYATAFAVTSYQLRKEHLQDLAHAKARIKAKQRETVDPAHAEQLRQVAAQLKKGLDNDKPPAYGLKDDEDTPLWRNAFREHFPELRPLLDVLEREAAAIATLRDRLRQEIRRAGMDRPPWVPAEFIPEMISVIGRKATTWPLADQLVFGWHESAGSVYWGDTALGFRVLSATGQPEEIAESKVVFEDLVRRARSWSEAANLRLSWDVHNLTKDAVIRQLETIALAENFATSCQLCRKP
jgi:hypothetical protein